MSDRMDGLEGEAAEKADLEHARFLERAKKILNGIFITGFVLAALFVGGSWVLEHGTRAFVDWRCKTQLQAGLDRAGDPLEDSKVEKCSVGKGGRALCFITALTDGTYKTTPYRCAAFGPIPGDDKYQFSCDLREIESIRH